MNGRCRLYALAGRGRQFVSPGASTTIGYAVRLGDGGDGGDVTDDVAMAASGCVEGDAANCHDLTCLGPHCSAQTRLFQHRGPNVGLAAWREPNDLWRWSC
jgi:hypothetical protein